MYIPKYYEENDVAVLHALIESSPLGTWTTLARGELVANHVPFLIHKDGDKPGTLVCHVARANPVWQDFSTDKESLVIFQGAQAYMSPNWYPSKHEHGRNVPTWCYMVVHAHGIPRKIEDPDWLLQHVSELSDTHESRQTLPWKVSDAPGDFIDMLLQGIVGIEIPLSRLEGKWKVDQNRSDTDKQGVIEALKISDDPQSQKIAEHISRQLQTGTGKSQGEED